MANRSSGGLLENVKTIIYAGLIAVVVRTVAFEAEFTPRNIQTRTDRDRLVYPVEVTVQNRDGKLRAGMPVQVSIPGTGRR